MARSWRDAGPSDPGSWADSRAKEAVAVLVGAARPLPLERLPEPDEELRELEGEDRLERDRLAPGREGREPREPEAPRELAGLDAPPGPRRLRPDERDREFPRGLESPLPGPFGGGGELAGGGLIACSR